jgi:sulfatase modifying factor 1
MVKTRHIQAPRALAFVALVGATGCNAVLGLDELPPIDDAGPDASSSDASLTDASLTDASLTDASLTDGASEAADDANPPDAPATDGATDATLVDVVSDTAIADGADGATDTGASDGAPTDASSDTPATEAGTADAADAAETTDPCAGVVCNLPPADTCADGMTVTVYSLPGSCSAGKCTYVSGTFSCASGSTCSMGSCSHPSCAGAGLTCSLGGTSTSCCDDKAITGGSFPMGRGASGSPDACPSGTTCDDTLETPEHTVTVGNFYLDTFEVTVGRFRNFVRAFPPAPAAGAGAGPTGGGWLSVWNKELAADATTLQSRLACSGDATWTSTPGANENKPINCVDWYTAQAFCIWDGGRLPSAAEWEYVAANGKSNNLYPWGQAAPDGTRANFYCASGFPCGGVSIADVGSYPAGASTFGPVDLSGNVNEWTRDDFVYANWYSAGSSPTSGCNTGWVNLCGEMNDKHVIKGGDYQHDTGSLRAAFWQDWESPSPYYRDVIIGFRCARDTP